MFFSLTSAHLDGDVLSCSWPRECNFAFSTVKIMPLVLHKIREERETVLLVAPNWPSMVSGAGGAPNGPSVADSVVEGCVI